MLINENQNQISATEFEALGLLVNVNVSLVEQVVENIDGINSCLTLLSVAEYQINPLYRIRNKNRRSKTKLKLLTKCKCCET